MLHRFAMANMLLIASENGEATSLTRAGEWIIVDRLFDDPRRLMISDSETLDPDNIPARAPDELPRRNTLVGDFAFQANSADVTYNLLLEAPEGIPGPSQGNFFASIGFVRLVDRADGDLTLSGSGIVRRPDGPLLWNFQANRVPWTGDLAERS